MSAESTYKQKMYVNNQWNNQVTVWVTYQVKDTSSTAYLYAQLDAGTKSGSIDIYPQSGKSDLFTVTFFDSSYNCWGIPYQTDAIGLPNQDDISVEIILDYNDKKVEFHPSKDVNPESKSVQLLGKKPSS